MRPFRFIAVSAVLASLFVAGTPAAIATGPETAPTPTRVMIVGDSITHGSAGDHTWRYWLWRHFNDNAVAVDMVGPSTRLRDDLRSARDAPVKSDKYAVPTFDSGHNARWGRFLGTWPGYHVGVEDTIRSDVLVHRPKYVVALMGLTDLFWFKTKDPAAVAQRMANFVRNARAGNPDVRVVLMAVPPTLSQQEDRSLGVRVADYNQRLSSLAAAASTTRSPVVYVQPPAGYQPDYNRSPHDTHDGTHPNARGEIRIADTVADVLSTRFNLGPAYPLVLAGAPTGPVLGFTLRCAPGDRRATLTWDESPGSTGYWFQRRVAGGAWSAQEHQVTIGDRPLVNRDLYNGVTYEYRLQAAKMYDKGVFSNVCTVKPSA